MWKPAMATRLLLLLILLAVSTVRGAAAARSWAGAGCSPSWCVCKPQAPDAALQITLDYACGNGADCAPLIAGAPCHSPDTLVARCSYAANSYFHRQAKANKDATCDFGGAATLTKIDPLDTYTYSDCNSNGCRTRDYLTDPSSKNCTYPATAAASTSAASPPAASQAASWCVCKPGLPDEAMLGTLDYACGHGADCDALHPGGQCHDPDTLLAHCSYAANSYFHSSTDADCDFAGTAVRSSTDPSSGTCKYPATDNTMTSPPAVENMALCFLLLMTLAIVLLVLCILLLYFADCGSSMPATVSDGMVVHVPEETRATAVAERPLYLVECGSSRPATISGGAAVEEARAAAAVPAAEEEEERPATTTCHMCYEAYNQGVHRISCIPCGHAYCKSCLENWLLWSQRLGYSSAKCPSCRRNYRKEQIIDVFGLN